MTETEKFEETPSASADADPLKISLSLDEIREGKARFFNDAPYAARVSLGLVVRLYHLRQNLREDHIIILEIEGLEGMNVGSVTKAAEQFRRPPLHPFWHKHFSAPRHIRRNIGIRWGLDRDGNDDLTRLIEDTARQHGDQPDLWPNYLTHHLVIGAYQERAGVRRMTGDWIIFAKHDGQNFYLDIATHEEGRDPEQLIRKLRQGSEAEFPFLFS